VEKVEDCIYEKRVEPEKNKEGIEAGKSKDKNNRCGKTGKALYSRRLHERRQAGSNNFWEIQKGKGLEKSMQKKRICLMLGLLFFSFIFFSQDVHAWLSGFDFRRAINITNSGSTALTDYQVLITLDTQTLISQGKMRSDCGDIRFALADDTLLNYWIESGCNTTSTKIWVKVPSIPASSSTTIYVYYGNSSATSLSNGIAVFVFYDDFDNRTTLGNWTVTTGTWQVANGTLNETAGTISTWNKIYTPISMTTNFMIEADINVLR